MGPPTATALGHRRTTEAGAETLIRHAHRVLDVAHRHRGTNQRLSASRVTKLVRIWMRTATPEDGPSFNDYILGDLDMTEQRRRDEEAELDRIGPPPPWRDPTGEAVVHNVIRGRSSLWGSSS